MLFLIGLDVRSLRFSTFLVERRGRRVEKEGDASDYDVQLSEHRKQIGVIIKAKGFPERPRE